MLKRILRLGTPGPADSFWYRPVSRPTAAGIDVTADVAMTYSAVWACTRLLSASGSCLPLNLFRRIGNRKEIAFEHPVQRMIHSQWNKELTSMQLRMNGIGQQVNLGNFYGEIERDGAGRPMAVWPIHASRVEPMRVDDTLVFKVKNNLGEPTFIADADMFHVSSMITEDGRIGRGVIENARDSIAMGLATERQGAAYHKRGRPAYAISGGRFKTQEDREFYRSTWEDVHAESGRPAMLPEGASLSVLGFSPEDQQFLATRQHNVEEIARWYGCPPHMIGHLLRSTFNNIEMQGIEFVVYSLIPWLKLWEEAIWSKLLTFEEQQTMFAKHNVEGLLRGDSKARSEFYEKMAHLGVLSINDILLKEDMNPIGPDGDQRFVPMNFTTLEKVAADDEPEAPVFPVIEEEPEDAMSALVGHTLEEPPISTTFVDLDRTADLALREQAVIESAGLMVADTLQRMLTKESRAVTRAASKQPAEFFAWVDNWYSSHYDTMTGAMARPIAAYLTASGEQEAVDEQVTLFVKRHVEASKEDVLRATELQPEQWDQLPAKLADVTAGWSDRVESWTVFREMSNVS